MKEILLDSNLPFYKANLHCHTTLSDGKKSREEIKESYKEHGYSIVAFSDHEHLIDNSNLNDEDFLAITSAELAIKENRKKSTLTNLRMKVCHLNLFSPDPHNIMTPCYSAAHDHFINDLNRNLIKQPKDMKRVYSTRGINKIIREANRQGFLVSFNHPSWSLQTERDYIGLDGLWAVEIYNTDVIAVGGMADEHVFDEMLRAGKKIFCTAADDNHNKNDDSFGGFVMINAEKLDYDVIFNALRYGYFYSSTAPVINSLVYEDGRVSFECSDVVRVSLITEGRRTDVMTGEKINSGEFQTREDDGYFRLVFTDDKGRLAWTQAYDIADFKE